MSIGNLPESLSQAILVGIMLVGRLGVYTKVVSFERNRFPSKETTSVCGNCFPSREATFVYYCARGRVGHIERKRTIKDKMVGRVFIRFCRYFCRR